MGQHALINIGSVSPIDGYSTRVEWPDSWHSSRRESGREHALINKANVSLIHLVFVPPRRYVTACTDQLECILYTHGILLLYIRTRVRPSDKVYETTCRSEWASYQICKNCGLRMRRECRERFARHWLHRKPLVSDSGMHHGACATHVPWCMSGSLTRSDGENVPGIPGACATRNFTYLAEAI